MRRLFALSALALAACSGGEARNVPPAEITAFKPVPGQPYDCTLFLVGNNGEAVAEADGDALLFVTLADDRANRGVVSYAGETLDLYPIDTPVFGGGPVEAFYAIREFPAFDVRVDLTPRGTPYREADGQRQNYSATIEMRRFENREPVVMTERAAVGSCRT